MNGFSETVRNKSNEELLKMVYEFDQWSPEMLHAIEQELLNRKILPLNVVEEKTKNIELEKIDLLKGKEASVAGQAIGWLTVFGFLGIAIGYNYAFSKVKSKYSASQYFKYNESSRKKGKNLFYASIFLSAIAILYKIITANGTNF